MKYSVLAVLLSSFLFLQLNTTPKLLIKIPTRNNRDCFFETLESYYKNISGLVPYHVVVSLDEDDSAMNNPEVIKRLEAYPCLSYFFKKPTSLVDRYARDLEGYDFDILISANDESRVVVRSFDLTIVEAMRANFPHFEGVLNFNASRHKAQWNSIPVIGKNCITPGCSMFNLSYMQAYFLEEFTLTSRILNKEAIIPLDLFDSKTTPEAPTHSLDYALFKQRQAHLFYISQEELEKVTPKVWSILICTLEDRKEAFEKLYAKITNQIKKLGLEDVIEVLYFKDQRQNTLAYKRTALLRASKGKYVCCIDDDDDIHENYVAMIYEALQQNPDCVSLAGIITFNGNNPRVFLHSLAYTSYYEKDGVYYRVPNHLNPIKRHYAMQYLVLDRRDCDDHWALTLASAGLLKSEVVIKEPYYFYKYIST